MPMMRSLPMNFLVVIFAGWLNRQQQAMIDYLRTENSPAPAEAFR